MRSPVPVISHWKRWGASQDDRPFRSDIIQGSQGSCEVQQQESSSAQTSTDICRSCRRRLCCDDLGAATQRMRFTEQRLEARRRLRQANEESPDVSGSQVKVEQWGRNPPIMRSFLLKSQNQATSKNSDNVRSLPFPIPHLRVVRNDKLLSFLVFLYSTMALPTC